jgi:membrane protease subunit (stomatin/prohibitin family)
VFVNQKVFTKLKWGTKEPVAFRDKELGMVRLRAFGNFTARVKEPSLFVNNMVGTMGRYTTDDAEGYLRDVIVARLNDLLGEQLDTFFNLPAIYDELGVALKTRVSDDFAKYGLDLIDFFVQAITPPEEVQKMIDERSGMGAVGDMNKFMQFEAAKSMREAASGGGTGGGGAAATGMGAGVGAGLGLMMPGMMYQAMSGAAQGQGQGQPQAVKACPKCQAQVPAAARFCPSCGEQMIALKKCPGCGKDVDASARFCPECGASLASASVCPNCKAELAPGAKFCGNCGTKRGG